MMSSRLRGSQGRDHGFTLIELLVVIIIIGTLSSIAIPTFLKQREKGWRSGAVADMKNAATAVETLASSNDGSFALLDGEDETSALLAAEGFNSSRFVSLIVSASDVSYCITGVTQQLPGKTFQFRSSTGVVDITSGSAPPC